MRTLCAIQEDRPIDVSVIIPTKHRPDKISACVERLGRQSLGINRYEVLVAADGPHPGLEDRLRGVWPNADGSLRVVECPSRGHAAARNTVLAGARGRVLVSLNDDVLAEPQLLETHLRAQDEATAAGRPALVIGACPWVMHEDDTVFDRMIRETSMIFFYNTMDDSEPDRDWGFRHAWLLNLSLPTDFVRSTGGFTVFPSPFGYEDDELAFRLAASHKTRVLYRPEARVHHDHRVTPTEYVEREYKLGYGAAGVTRTCPEFASAMFRRNVLDQGEIDSARREIRASWASVPEWTSWFGSLSQQPAGGEGVVIDDLYQRHVPLKRHVWKTGLIDAVDGRPREWLPRKKS